MALENQRSEFLKLPIEIRLEIISYVLEQGDQAGFRFYDSTLLRRTGLYVDEAYSSSHALRILLTCRQFSQDFMQIAFRKTHFVVADTFTPVREHLNILAPSQIADLRNISFVVAGPNQFRDMVHWKQYPFDIESIRLDTLSVVFHRSGSVHYPHDFTHALVALLRRLQHVKKIRFIRNGANIKGFFKTWYNRLIGLILKEDHHHRYDLPGEARLPACWWDWRFDQAEQTFELVAREPMGVMEEGEYMEMVKPRVDRLMKDFESEEVDPDPRARIGW